MIYKNIQLDWLGHSGFKIKFSNQIIYIDPFKIKNETEQADFILITHNHYDHCSIEDIKKIAKENTIIICPADCQSKFRHIENIIHIKIAEPATQLDFKDRGLKVWGFPAYNLNKDFHIKEQDWLGFILQLGDEEYFTTVYHAGDTDLIPEMSKLKATNIDLALLPIGGTYTMNAGEAAKAASLIRPKIVIPIHFGTIEKTGSRSDADIFLKHCSQEGLDARVLDKTQL